MGGVIYLGIPHLQHIIQYNNEPPHLILKIHLRIVEIWSIISRKAFWG